VADPDTKFTIEETTFWSAVPKISTQVSAAFNQKIPAVWVLLQQRIARKLISEDAYNPLQSIIRIST
jgi:hypothetical protein